MAATPRGMKSFYGILAVVAIVGIGVLAWLSRRPKSVAIPADAVITTADTAGFRGYLLGSPTAPVEITEYADYQCPACQSFETVQFPDVRSQLIETGRVRWRYRDWPITSIHRHALEAAHAAACADEQGKYWEMHRLIYESQPQWENARDASAIFRNDAKSAGLDEAKYDACMQSAKYAGRIRASFEEGQRLGVNSTPTFVIGNRLYPGGMSSDALRKLVDSIAPVGTAAK